MRCDAAGANCLDITGGLIIAGFDRYTLVPADVGHRIRLRVFVSSVDSSGSAVSEPTDVVTEAGDGNLVPDANVESDPAPSFYTAGTARSPGRQTSRTAPRTRSSSSPTCRPGRPHAG